MLEAKKIAVVIPAYCEAMLLPRTLENIPDYVDIVIVIDDGSPDETYDAARQGALRDKRLHVIRLGFNRGVGGAIMRGYREAVARGADAIAVMAGDDQMDPAELEAVLLPVVRGEADYAKGNRLAHPEANRMPLARRAGTRLLGSVTGLIAGLPGLTDAQCGYTAIHKDMVEALPLDEVYPRYGYPNDLLLRLGEHGARVTQPVVRPIYADEVSGFRIHQVVLPISGILMRGVLRRLKGDAAISRAAEVS